MVVEKAVKMAEMMEVPILGLVENMSYVACPDCGKKIHLFGEGKTAEAARRHNLPLLAEMPIDPALAALTDAGDIESFQGQWLDAAAAVSYTHLCSTIKITLLYLIKTQNLSVALLHLLSIHCSVFKVRSPAPFEARS